MRPISRETIVERRQPLMRWSAVFAGTVLGLGVWILLQTLGMGLGLSTVDIDNTGSLRAVGIGTGIWSIIAPLIAMFIGAFIAGRLDGSRSAGIGAMHGAVTWALSTVLGLWLMLSILGALASGAAKVGTAAAGATGSVVSSAVSAGGGAGKAMNALGIDTNDLLGPINQRLQQQGKPAITADQLNATLRGVAQRGLHEGKLDRNVVVQELANNTSLSEADAQDVANQIETRYEQARSRVGSAAEQVKETAKTTAQEAADKTGKALLIGGVMMILSLAASLGGGALGGRRTERTTEPPLGTRRAEPVREEVPPEHLIVPATD
jgi:hypothetical protein